MFKMSTRSVAKNLPGHELLHGCGADLRSSHAELIESSTGDHMSLIASQTALALTSVILA